MTKGGAGMTRGGAGMTGGGGGRQGRWRRRVGGGGGRLGGGLFLPVDVNSVGRMGGFRQIGGQGFVYHVVYDGAGGVVGAGLFAGGVAGFRVVGGQQVFKDFAQKFGVQGDFLFRGGVLFYGEFVFVEQGDHARIVLVPAEEQAVGNGVAAA